MSQAEDIAAAFGVDQCAQCGRLRHEGEQFDYRTGWLFVDAVKVCGVQCYLRYRSAVSAAEEARQKQELDATKLAVRRSMPKFFGFGNE